MKFAYTLLLGACLSLGGALTLDAQNTVPVAISSEVISSNGYSFYAHKVLPRQTLYSISKAYNVTIDQIYAVNEGLKQKGLKANTIILIPKSTPATTQVETAATTSTSTTAMAEPEKEEETLDINSIPFVTHIVKWYEDLTSICEKYDIKEEVVMKFNNLKSRVLASRQQLKIPSDKKDFEAILKAKAIEIVNNVVGEKTPETATTETVGENNATEHNFFNIFKPQNRIRIALFLPFEQNKEKNDYKDFYSGVLLAIHNNPEITIDLDVYDSGTTNLNNVHWDKTDVVIGPVSPQDIE
ncbi:MAG: LysM peptidoglycan-binding domain-containing protein, partial [Bacteroidales bacterium]|nr:LysM peptidoglycan-binding domain-containing protein [Bacteroidales bacterium]